MKPAPFDYISPSSLAEALEIKAQNGDEAKILAGGQSLIPTMNFRLTQPSLLVDLNGLGELDYITGENGSGIRIGAMTRQRTVERSELVGRQSPLLFETMPFIAHAQIRNRGTIGGSLAHADPAAELPVVMVALEAQFTLSNQAGQRTVVASDFFQGLFNTDLQDNEILTEILIPAPRPRSGYAFTEFARRQGDYALLGVAAVLTLDAAGRCEGARLIYLNAGEVPIDARSAAAILVGRELNSSLFEEAGRAAADSEINVTSTIHASEGYLKHLARVLTSRVLTTALQRAMNSKSNS